VIIHQESTSQATASQAPTKVAIKDLHKATMAPTISHTSNIRMTALHHRINTIKVHQNLLTLFNSSNTASISMVALLLRAMINVSNIALSLDMHSLKTIKVLPRHLSNGTSSMDHLLCHHKDSTNHLSASTHQLQAKQKKTVALWAP
jgi:hypothetical protein